MPDKVVPLVEFVINDDDESGVDYVALVDRPAIERNWMAFAEPFQFKVVSEEKRMVMGPLMVANQPIYRNDGGKEYYCIFSAETIGKIVRKFMRNGFLGNVNQMHNERAIAKDCYMIESFMIDPERGLHTPEGFATLPSGSWFGSYQIDNDEIWAKVKEGKFAGFSVEGMFDERQLDSIDMAVAEALIQELIA